MAARALGNVADLLGCLAAGRGGMRSGPASNAQWTQAFQLLEVCVKLTPRYNFRYQLQQYEELYLLMHDLIMIAVMMISRHCRQGVYRRASNRWQLCGTAG